MGPEHLDDLAKLNALCGFPARSVAGWHWALFENPEQGDEPVGYVVLKDGRGEGFMCTQRRVYKSRTATHDMVVAHTLITLQNAPGTGMRLVRHLLKSHGADAVNTLNNNALSAPIYPRLGTIAWRGEAGRYFLERPIRWSALLRSRVYNSLASAGMRPLVAKWEHLQRGVRPLPEEFNTSGFSVLDPEDRQTAEQIDRFNAAVQDGDLLQPNRASEIWRYRLGDPDYHDAMRLLGCVRDGELVALLAVSLAKDDPFSATTLEIEDMISLSPEAVSETMMLGVASEIARKVGAARVRCRIISPELTKTPPSGWLLRQRYYDSAHMLSRVEDLPGTWQAGPFDSDFFFATRRPERLRVIPEAR